MLFVYNPSVPEEVVNLAHQTDCGHSALVLNLIAIIPRIGHSELTMIAYFFVSTVVLRLTFGGQNRSEKLAKWVEFFLMTEKVEH